MPGISGGTVYPEKPCLPLRKAESAVTVHPTDTVPPFTQGGIGGHGPTYRQRASLYKAESGGAQFILQKPCLLLRKAESGARFILQTLCLPLQGESRRLNPIETCLVTRGSRFIPQSPCLLYKNAESGGGHGSF